MWDIGIKMYLRWEHLNCSYLTQDRDWSVVKMEKLLEYLNSYQKMMGYCIVSISLQIWRSGMCRKEISDTTACTIINSKLDE
jgi:hypothetical protein